MQIEKNNGGWFVNFFPQKVWEKVENFKAIIQMTGITDNMIPFCLALTIFGLIFSCLLTRMPLFRSRSPFCKTVSSSYTTWTWSLFR